MFGRHHEGRQGHEERRDCAGRHGRGRHRFGRHGFGGRFGGDDEMMHAGRLLAQGDLRLIALKLIEEQPRHGYDIIKALEERSHGVYSPSPGVVYPTLTYLEEVGYASATSEGNKKVYTITGAGRAHLEENRDLADMVLDGIEKFGRRMAQAKAWWEGARDGRRGSDRDIPGVIDEVNEARRDLKAAIAEKLEGAAEDLQRRVARALRDAAETIRKAGGPGKPDDVIDL